MQINKIGINNSQLIGFKANYFTVIKEGKYYNLLKISTDNEENLGKEPVLEYQSSGKKFEFPMTYDGKYYTTYVYPHTDNYRIFYKDTGKYENNGEKQIVNPLCLARKATIADRTSNDLPIEEAYSKGETVGKVIYADSIDSRRQYSKTLPKDVPIILLLGQVKQNSSEVLNHLPENVKGVIVHNSGFSVFGHIANQIRQNLLVMSTIWDNDKFNDLKKYEGKFIHINNESGIVNYHETNPIHLQAKIERVEKVEVPRLENVERLLTFDELTPQNCGNKGYRLALMQKLVKEGKLKDITIPKGFVIPEGYINRLKEYINVEDDEESKDRLDGIYTQEVEQKVKELGMTRDDLIVRSNFNTEDLGSFSSAEIYDSRLNMDTNILETTLDVADNIDYKKTKYVHQKYGICDKQIQPAVIVQDAIDKDYAFTVYSDDGDGNAIIQLTYKVGFAAYHDSVIKYNKKTKKLTLDNNMSPKAEFILDEKGNVVAQHHEKDRIAEEWDTLKPLLGIVISGANELEKFFKHPQDIEGGIGKDGKVYFWQTRDIVAKGKKRI